MKKQISLLLAIAALFSYQQTAYSSGFFLIEQSVSSMGNAYAGGAAVAEDASTVFFNPAGMTKICDYQVVSGAQFVIPSAQFKDKGSLHLTGVPMTGSNGHDAGEPAVVPHTYIVKSFQDCRDCGWSLGFGVNSPFGLATDYGHKWKGRYHAIRSQILTINLNPCAAYRFNRCWSVGAGLDVQYMHAKLSNAVDFGLIALLNGVPLGTAIPQQQDGKVILKGNSWGYGGNIGVLWEPSCRTRFGAHFRTEIKHNLKGSEKFKKRPAVITGIPALAATFKDTRVKSDITLPSIFSVSGYHEFNNCWAIMGDVTWTKWNVIKDLHFIFKNPLQEATNSGTVVLKWQNALRYSIGTTYRPSDCWTFRGGLSYDETPIPNKKYRTPRLPGEDRFWTALGLGYKWNNCLHLDLGYAHLFIKEPKIDKSERGALIPGTSLVSFKNAENNTKGGLKGDYDARTDIVSAQLVWDF